MASMDVFHQDPFTEIELTAAVEKIPFLPVGIGELDLFEDSPIRTRALMVEERDGVLSLVPTSARGSSATERTTEVRKMRYFEVPRLRVADTIYADEIQSIRAFGQESEVMQVQTELARRISGPTGLQSMLEYTFEYHRLGAIQGILYDSNGNVLYDWFNEFEITPNAEVVFNLPAKTLYSLRPLCNALVRNMARNAKGAFRAGTQVYAVCGDEFWDNLVTHPDVEKTYLNWVQAAELRNGTAFSSMKFADINWINYRGSDDTTTIAIPTNKAQFFPKGAPGVFKRAWAPGESFTWVNTLGKPMYVQMIYDKDRNAWVRAEVSSYPLHICTRPEVLFEGTMDSTAD